MCTALLSTAKYIFHLFIFPSKLHFYLNITTFLMVNYIASDIILKTFSSKQMLLKPTSTGGWFIFETLNDSLQF